MNKKEAPARSCKICVHKDLPGTSEICRDCWNYQRWKNFQPGGVAELERRIGGNDGTTD